ncbi:MAG: UTRA domain-containing protein [Limimaricola sp.]|uniref:GntR family transcriptional regulator n=1 Tax=Limimaricola sp. TaxID=2211665 RepID=UPI001E0509DE|nr:GntR family transcriptional regulator [Limimaricola sp.]MBI1418608.1 UTRA domain-containing protein [Limimaricola sp.]
MSVQAGRGDPGRGSLPKYIQISEMLIRRIAAGQLADGTRLPPEREMAQGLGIAVGTLRKALADLDEKGLLHRVQGSGNYIRTRPEVASLYAFFRLERVEGGGLPTAEVLSLDLMGKPSDAPDFGPSTLAHRIRRLRRLDGETVALEEIWLDASHAQAIAAGELVESLYLYYRRALGLVITRAEDRVGAAPMPDWTPPAAPLPAGATAGFITRLAWAQTGARAEYSRTWFDSEKAVYVNRMGRG